MMSDKKFSVEFFSVLSKSHTSFHLKITGDNPYFVQQTASQ